MESKRKQIIIAGLLFLDQIAARDLGTAKNPPRLKRTPYGLREERRDTNFNPTRKGLVSKREHTHALRQSMLSVLKSLGFPPPLQRAQGRGDDYRSPIRISNYQDPFAEAPPH